MAHVHRTIEYVVPYDGEVSDLYLGDIRKLVDIVKGAPTGAKVEHDAHLSDGKPADTFTVSWTEEV